jgi:hypothetical protein
VIDDARDHEQRALVQRVRQQAYHQRFEGDLTVLPDQHDQHP